MDHQPQVGRPSLAFDGTRPRLAYHLLRGEDSQPLHVSASADGLAWGEPLQLPSDGADQTGGFQSLAIDAQGRAVIAAQWSGSGTGAPGTHGGPKLLRSEDFQVWTVAGADPTRQLGPAGRYVTATFRPDDTLLLSLAWDGPEEDAPRPLAAGVLLWREP